MSYENITLERRDAVATLTLNRPNAANSIDLPLARELMDAAIACDDDPEVRAVVLTGAGAMFCAGGDLRSFAAAGTAIGSRLKELTAYLHAAISRLDAHERAGDRRRERHGGRRRIQSGDRRGFHDRERVGGLRDGLHAGGRSFPTAAPRSFCRAASATAGRASSCSRTAGSPPPRRSTGDW